MQEATKETFNELVVSNDIVLVDFWAPWCGPCKMMDPILEELDQKRPDVLIVKVNVDEQPELTKEHEIMSIPHYASYYKGEEVASTIGAMSLAKIEEFLS